MGRGATIAAGNVWYKARKNAALGNDKLSSKEGAAELMNVSVDVVDMAERNRYKKMPPEVALSMADVYGAPELRNHYCLNWCPIGIYRSISDERIDIQTATLQLTKLLRKKSIHRSVSRLQDIAEDGKVSEDEVGDLDEVLAQLKETAKSISRLEIIRESIRY